MKKVALILAWTASVCGTGHATTLSQEEGGHWVRTWGAAMQAPDAVDYYPDTGKNLRDQTLRQIVRVSMGGSRFRISLSNEFGTRPLEIGEAHVALSDSQASIRADSDRQLTFSGNRSVVIPPGAVTLSDAVLLSVPDLGRLAVTFYLPKSTTASVLTVHQEGLGTGYLSQPGNHCGDAAMKVAGTLQSLFFLSAVDVAAPQESRTLITLGDSITDGLASTPNEFRRWPDVLSERLSTSAPHKIAVANMGISGNRVLRDWSGPSALARFARDVLTAPNVGYLVILEGINDIGAPGFLKRPEEQTGDKEIVAGLRQLAERAHEHGIRMFLGTMTPSAGSNEQNPGYDTVNGEQVRQAVNAWVRTQAVDDVIDFDAVIRDPKNPAHLLADFDSGDHLHPNDAGYRAMAEAMERQLLARRK